MEVWWEHNTERVWYTYLCVICHIKDIHQPNIFSCNKCSNKFPDTNNYGNHVRNVHTPNTYECHNCEIRFKHTSHLNSLWKKHMKEPKGWSERGQSHCYISVYVPIAVWKLWISFFLFTQRLKRSASTEVQRIELLGAP